MKRNIISFLTIAGISTVLFLNSCKKKEDPEPDYTSEQSTQSQDESNMENISEEANDEVNNLLSGASFGGRTEAPDTANGISYILDQPNKTLTITFTNSKSRDFRRTRNGQIIAKLTNGSTWADMGAVMTQTFVNLKVTNPQGKTIVLNGIHTITNVTGGLARLVGTASGPVSVTHLVTSSNMEITFDDGSKRTWSVSRKRTISGTKGNRIIKLEGTGSDAGISNLVQWGTSRNGSKFYTVLSTPVEIYEACSWKPLKGVKTHKGLTRELTVTFGVDAQGTDAGGDCGKTYGMRLNWTSLKGEPRVAVVSY